MLPVLGKPMVERVMEPILAHGVSDFTLVVSPDDAEIAHHFRYRSNVRLVHQTERQGMAHALFCAAPLIRGDFVLSACDSIVSAEHVGRLMAAWQAEPSPHAVLALMTAEPERLGDIAIVETDGPRVTRIVEKPSPAEAPSDITSLPLYCFSPRILDYLPKVPLSPRGEYELQDAIQLLIERDGHIRGVMLDQRLTLTNPNDLLTINQHYLAHSNDPLLVAADQVGPNAQFVPPLRIEARTVIGADCTIGPGVYVEQDCRLGDGATIRNAIILRASTVPDGATIEEKVISH
jgi:glucose-1-phosphate thymidylyltransferase